MVSLGRANLSVALAFVLVFAGVGTWYVARSEAAGYGCAGNSYSEWQAWGSSCVKHIQRMLDVIGGGPYKPLCYVNASNILNRCDGDFGPQTKADVVLFQNDTGIRNPPGGGVVGSRTWRNLCLNTKEVGDSYDYYAVGCDYYGY